MCGHAFLSTAKRRPGGHGRTVVTRKRAGEPSITRLLSHGYATRAVVDRRHVLAFWRHCCRAVAGACTKSCRGRLGMKASDHHGQGAIVAFNVVKPQEMPFLRGDAHFCGTLCSHIKARGSGSNCGDHQWTNDFWFRRCSRVVVNERLAGGSSCIIDGVWRAADQDDMFEDVSTLNGRRQGVQLTVPSLLTCVGLPADPSRASDHQQHNGGRGQ